MSLDWNRIIEQALGSATIIVPAALAAMVRLRKIDQNQQTALKNQDRIETKADGNHARALEAVRETSRENAEQLIKAIEKVLTAQSRRAERRSTDDPESAPKRGRRSTDPKEPSK